MAKSTPEQRSELGKKAVAARLAKSTPEKRSAFAAQARARIANIWDAVKRLKDIEKPAHAPTKRGAPAPMRRTHCAAAARRLRKDQATVEQH
jgi:hypothetical protein